MRSNLDGCVTNHPTNLYIDSTTMRSNLGPSILFVCGLSPVRSFTMQKFSNFSLNLFLLLFGFFCGNLLPGGSIEFPWNSAQGATRSALVAPHNTEQQPKPEEIQTSLTKLFTAQSLEKTISNNIYPEIRSTPQQTWGSGTNQILCKVIPGPGFLGFIIVILTEFINWCGVYARQPSSQIRSRERTPKFLFKARASGFYFGNSRRAKLLAYLNSFKIGFLLGIFVDAFKVGS